MGKRDNKPWEPTPKNKIKLDALKRPIEEHVKRVTEPVRVYKSDFGFWGKGELNKLIPARWGAPSPMTYFDGTTTKPEPKPDTTEDWAEKWVKDNG